MNFSIKSINLEFVSSQVAAGLTNLNVCLNDDDLPIREPSLFHVSVYNSDEELFDFLVSMNVDVNLSFTNGTALHLAVHRYENNLNIIRKLISLGIPLNTRECIMGWTSLHLACHQGKVEVAKLLIDSGADMNISNIYNIKDPSKNWGTSPLHVAINNEQNAIIELLCKKGANIDAESMELGTPLIYAIVRSKIEAAKILISYGADINIVSKVCLVKACLLTYVPLRVFPLTALHTAILKADDRAVKIFLLHSTTNINTPVRGYVTPLHYAIKYNSAMLNELLNAGADINVLTVDNKTVNEYLMEVWPEGSEERNVIGQVLVEHATKLSVAGLYVNERVVTNHGIFANQCFEELELMKRVHYGELLVSVYDLFGCVHDLALKLTKKEIKCLFRPEIKSIFPIFGEIIQYRALRVLQRSMLLSGPRLYKIRRFIYEETFHKILPEDFIARIMAYMSYNDLFKILNIKSKF